MSSELEVRQTEAVEVRRSGLVDLQRRYRTLGRIRMGEKGPKGAPRKIADWRLTSPSEELLDVAAGLYGGEVKVWEGAPTEGRQYELYSGTDRLDVLVAPGEPLSQAWEMWSGGGCTRRCNGAAQTTGEPCACPADLEERLELAQKGQACKPTTRLSVVLPRIPDVGVWRLDSHGMNAAVELPGTVDLLRMALEAGQPIPAQLRIEQRTSKKDGQTRHYVVPVLELPSVTVQQLMSGQAVPARPTAVSPPATQAIGAPKPPEKPKAAAPRRAPEAPALPTDDPPPPRAAAPKPGELTVFQRAITNVGKRHGLDGPELDALVRFATADSETPRQALTEVTEPDEANAISKAGEAFGRGELELHYAEDGTPTIKEASA